MNEIKLRQIEKRIDNLISLRATDYLIILTITGGIVTLLYNLTRLNIFLLVIGVILDIYYLLTVANITHQIHKLIKRMELL